MTDEDPELAMLVVAFERLGAPPAQAAVMAAQLLKRARQIAQERGIGDEAALAELLTKVAAGRRGEYGSDGSGSDAGSRGGKSG